MQEPERPLLVIGHRNPDTDSVCAAIAYARFKADSTGELAVPCRAGNLNRQTSFVLSHFDVESPRFLTDVHPRVADIMVKGPKLIALKESDPLAAAHAAIVRNRFSFLPVQDVGGKCAGRITALRLAELVGDLSVVAERPMSVALDALPEAIGGELRLAPKGERVIRGALCVGGPGGSGRTDSRAAPLWVVPDLPVALEGALRASPRLLISCGASTPGPAILEKARQAGCAVLTTPLDVVNVTVRLLLMQPLGEFLDREIKVFAEQELVRTARREMEKSNEGGFIVVDEERRIRGVITRINLLTQSRFRLALVDHNELAQAVEGAEEAEIVEVIDHHRLGGPATDAPITFINRVVGSTCTIVADLYRTHGLLPPRPIAGIMLAALLSDTLVLRSPTTTSMDLGVADWLSQIAGVEVEAFGEQMFEAGSELEGMDADAILAQDRKLYEERGVRFAVSQIEVVGFGRFQALQAELGSRLDGYLQSSGARLACLMVTDITRDSSLLLCSGDRRFVDAIGYPRVGDELFEMKGVLSRKKQLLPYLLELIRATE